MKITKATFSKTHLSFDEKFNLSLTLQMGSGEALYKKYGGSVKVMFSPSPMANLNDESWSFPWIEEVAIAEGAAKTFSFTGKKIPAKNEADFGVIGQTFEEWFKAGMTDGGAARAWPVSVGVWALDEYNGLHDYTAIKNNAFTMLLSRLKPVFRGCSIIDAGTVDTLSVFDAFVQGESKPRFIVDAELDPLDPTLKIASCRLVITDPDGMQKAYTAAEGSIAIDTPVKAGTYSWSCTVTDSAGYTSDANANSQGTFEVLAYSRPKIENFRVTRYSESEDGAGNTVYTEDEEGNHVWIDFAGKVTPVAGSNAWELTFDHEVRTGDIPGVVNGIVGVDGEDIIIEADRSIITGTFNVAHSYSFTAVLKDVFGSVTRTFYINKAGADFVIGPFGVGDGGRPTGTRGNPHSDFYRLCAFHGGIEGVTTYSKDEVRTGGLWIDGKPIYRRVFTASVVANTAKYMAHDTDLGTVLRLDGVIYAETEARHYPLSYQLSDNSTRMRMFVGANSIAVNSTLAGTVVVIMEYTKASDVPVDPSAGWQMLLDKNGYVFVTAEGGTFTVEEG